MTEENKIDPIVLNVMAMIAQYAATENLTLRTGMDSNRQPQVYIDTIRWHQGPVRLNRRVNVDYSYKGEHLTTIITLTCWQGKVQPTVSKEDAERLYEVYGAEITKIIGDINVLE